ncbi:hypothetical protein [Yoonia sp. BS5-3]|uniref:Uncharacterized protein n=1 Tax=Yoonia phaeophyticola TaxID=3137369 RepID=A0ABZ2V1Z9_9RHOB
MRPAFMLLPLVALTACATPREQCIADVTRDTRILSSLINETEANLARGYALDERREVRTITRTCRGETSEGEAFSFPCKDTRTVTTTQPVAIDLEAEAAKLESLRERFELVQAGSNQAVAQCIAVHPE